MPRQIIDVESSRPAYVRRRVASFVGIALGLLVLAAVVWAIFGRLVGNGPH